MKETLAPLSEGQLAAVLSTLTSSCEDCCCGHELLSLMREDSHIYRGRGTSEVERLRAYVMAGIAKAGLADQLMPFVLEELETGTSPYTVAAAARAARSASTLPRELPELLARAIERIRHRDEFIHLDAYPAPLAGQQTTAVSEVIETLRLAGPYGHAAIRTLWQNASTGGYFPSRIMQQLEEALGERRKPGACCGRTQDDETASEEPRPGQRAIADLVDIEVQNQDGTCATFGQTFGGRASLIAFFYTRCMNPDKCSRTISQLARVCDLVRRKSAYNATMIAGITYDPDYDLPERLHRYGADRGFVFDEGCQLLRTTGSFDVLREAFQLGVGYGSSTINRHRIELILIDPAGRIAEVRQRRLWDGEELADALMTLSHPLGKDHRDSRGDSPKRSR